jgi:hypothetical protein
MSEPVDAVDEKRLSGIDIAASIFVAFNVAVAQPLLDLLGKNPTFFVARRAPVADVVFFALLFTVGLPALTTGVILGCRALNRRLGIVVHGIALGGLLALLALQIVKRAVGGWPWIIIMIVAAGIGLACVLAFQRARGIRTVSRWLLPVPLAVAVLFLFVSPVHTLVLQRNSFTLVANARITKPAPVIMVVFDEFPIASLMNADGKIDSHLYPNFAALASQSTWFRNATAAHDFTEKAVPAIQTGKFTRPGQLPTAQDHPNSIFRLLAGSYDMRAHEALTQLCPASTCKETSGVSFSRRWRSLLSDVELVYEHQVLPDSLEKTRPRVDQSWGNFAAADDNTNKPTKSHPFGRNPTEDDPLRDFRGFLADITADSSRPQFDFVHVLIPHAPWHYLPSEQTYVYPKPLPGLSNKTWTTDPWPVEQAYERHLLQVQFADSLVGDLLKKLKKVGLLDKAIIGITADHGVSFTPGEDYRHVVRRTVPEISQVPFFIKAPGQKTGHVSDLPVMTIDMVPSIADLLGVTGMYPTDGHSVFDKSKSWKDRVIFNQGFTALHIGTSGSAKFDIVDRKLGEFGDGSRISSLYDIAPQGYRDVLSLRPGGGHASGASVTIENASAYRNFDPSAPVLPAYVFGDVNGLPEHTVVAIAVNGRIVAVTRTYRIAGNDLYGALTPLASYHAGANDVKVYLVRGSPGARTFAALS